MSDESCQVCQKPLASHEAVRVIGEGTFCGPCWAERLLPPAEKRLAACIGGARACPPEDVGGVGGYLEFLEAIADPEHERHEELLGWAGGAFDPELFDVAKANALVERTLRRR